MSRLKLWLARSTIFATAIFITGTVLICKHLMTGGDWVAMAGIVHTMVVARALGDDYHQRNNQNGDPH